MPTEQEKAESRRRKAVAEAVARANSNAHRTPEHAAWCRHLYDRRCLTDSHVVCMTAGRGTAA